MFIAPFLSRRERWMLTESLPFLKPFMAPHGSNFDLVRNESDTPELWFPQFWQHQRPSSFLEIFHNLMKWDCLHLGEGVTSTNASGIWNWIDYRRRPENIIKKKKKRKKISNTVCFMHSSNSIKHWHSFTSWKTSNCILIRILCNGGDEKVNFISCN